MNFYETAHSTCASSCVSVINPPIFAVGKQINVYGNLSSTANGAANYAGADWHFYSFTLYSVPEISRISLSGSGFDQYTLLINPGCNATYSGSTTFATLQGAVSVTVAVVSYPAIPGLIF